jgi:hypothetical protein
MRLRSATLALAASLLLPLGGPDGTVAPAAVTIDASSAAWVEQVEWGVGRFRRAGLELPPMAVTVHADRAPCDGNDGLFRPRVPVEVHLCSPAPTGSRAARLITLHELAHAWAETQLTGDRRASFLAHRRLRAWRDPALAPHEWGAEHAAEVVSWGLMDEVVPIVRIYDAEPEVLSVAFEHLTGRAVERATRQPRRGPRSARGGRGGSRRCR